MSILVSSQPWPTASRIFSFLILFLENRACPPSSFHEKRTWSQVSGLLYMHPTLFYSCFLTQWTKLKVNWLNDASFYRSWKSDELLIGCWKRIKLMFSFQPIKSFWQQLSDQSFHKHGFHLFTTTRWRRSKVCCLWLLAPLVSLVFFVDSFFLLLIFTRIYMCVHCIRHKLSRTLKRKKQSLFDNNVSCSKREFLTGL